MARFGSRFQYGPRVAYPGKQWLQQRLITNLFRPQSKFVWARVKFIDIEIPSTTSTF